LAYDIEFMVEVSQQQAEEMKEKLANMSPEELKEFQKKQCIFCQIISGKVASKKIYSDDKCTAILDINPANPGHILLLPNEHYGIMPLMPEEELGHLFMVAKALAHASLKALEAQGTNIFVANGVAAGQKAQHFMIHVIPRKEGDNVNINIPEKDMGAADAEKIIGRLKPAIEKALGVPKKKEAEEKKEEHEEGEKAEEKKEPAKKTPKGKFITSEKARRFHSPECPFAEKIPEDSRIYIDEKEAEEQGKIPCGCTGLKRKKAKPKKEKKKEEPEEEAEKEEAGKEEPEEDAEETEEEAPEEETTLDDISSMLAGGR
jgi:histidine triad (HIT) family protein